MSYMSIAITVSVTIILFFLLHYFVEPNKQRNIQKRSIIEKKLEKLYGPIYALVFREQNKLNVKLITHTFHVEEDEPPFVAEELKVRGDFESIVVPIGELVINNIHYLNKEDEKLWMVYEAAVEELDRLANGGSGSSDHAFSNYYQSFKDFIDSSVKNYHILRKNYFNEDE
jgi:hypothetical protein